MDYSKIIALIEQGSLFELYRLQIMLRKMLDDPKRIHEIRVQLRPNQMVSYFDDRTNQEIEATILDLGRTYVGVQHRQDGKKWKIHYYMLKLQKEFNPSNFSTSGKVNSLTLKVGEHVGFVNRAGVTLYGVVIKLNQKTASIELSTGAKWRVSYHLLFYVIEGIFDQGILNNSSFLA